MSDIQLDASGQNVVITTETIRPAADYINELVANAQVIQAQINQKVADLQGIQNALAAITPST